jgi:hypothetical protein
LSPSEVVAIAYFAPAGVAEESVGFKPTRLKFMAKIALDGTVTHTSKGLRDFDYDSAFCSFCEVKVGISGGLAYHKLKNIMLPLNSFSSEQQGLQVCCFERRTPISGGVLGT